MILLEGQREHEIDMKTTPCIKVIGLGGAGSNAVDRMITVDFDDVGYIAANTDLQSLERSEAGTKIQLGPVCTRGLGAGGNPEVGESATFESSESITNAIRGADLLFIVCGMGGGTGTGSAPIVAKIAQELGILTIGVVSTPFEFEGTNRGQVAIAGTNAMEKYVNTLLVVQNDQLLRVAPKSLTLEVAFRVADDILRQAIQGIVELVTRTGVINLDFASVSSVIQRGGRSIMAIGRGDTVVKAAKSALEHPLLEDNNIASAEAILVHVSGGVEVGLNDVNDAMANITALANPAADVLFGASEDFELNGQTQVILMATGINANGRLPLRIKSLFGTALPIPEPIMIEDELPRDRGTMTNLDIPAFIREREMVRVHA